MKIYQYLQTQGISRRNCIQAIKSWEAFVNTERIESFNHEVNAGDVITIKDWENWMKTYTVPHEEKKSQTIVLFNKPKWYVVSKDDKHNKTIYEILPAEFRNTFYYIWRLDKESHWLIILTDNPKLVNEYEHPKHWIIKEYIVEINREMNKADQEQCITWITDDWDLLKFKSIKSYSEWWKYFVNILLNEWKKRHIRRVLSFLHYHVEDLQRIKEGEFELWNIKIGEHRKIG